MSEVLVAKVVEEEEDDDDDDFMNNLLDDMEPDDDEPITNQPAEDVLSTEEVESKQTELETEEEETEKKAKEVQRKYFEGVYEIFTDLDLSQIAMNGENQIQLKDLKAYIKMNNLAVPGYLSENIFYTIDYDRNGWITPIEYLKWKTRVTVDDIAALTETIVKAEAEEEEEEEIDIGDIDIEDMDIDLDDGDLFDVVAIMDEEEEKQQMDDMLKTLEKAAEEKRVLMEQKKKEMEEEETKRKQYAEEHRMAKEAEEERIRVQQEEIQRARRALDQEKNEMERNKKIEKLKALQAIIQDDEDGTGKAGRDHEDDDEKSNDSDASFDENESTDSDWDSESGFSDADGGQTMIIEEENDCIKFCPWFAACCCCNKPKITRQRTHDHHHNNNTKQEKNDSNTKDIVKVIASGKRRLSKFIYKYGDDYVDDGTMVLSNDRLHRLTKDFGDEMRIYFWSLVLDKQSQKAYDCLWPVLRFLATELPTPITVELIRLYRVELSRYPPSKIEGITRRIVESSEFAIATALVIASFFAQRSKSDLANTRLLSAYSTEYQNIAAEELRQIESDYLATMTMGIKSFHDGSSTPFEIAVDNELMEFLSSDRMGRIAHAMWVKRDLLRPEISENSFEVRATGLLAVVRALSGSAGARDFYFTPIGFHFTETFLFFIYLFIFTLITIFGSPSVASPLTWYDWLLFVCNFGYIFNEILQFIDEGPAKYFATWENAIDITVSLLWIVIMFLRILCVLLIDNIDLEIMRDMSDADSFINLLFTALWVINIILLWIRCLHFLMLSTQEGPLINVMISMASDVKNWLAVFIVITVGFVFGTYFLVGDTNVYLSTEQRALSLTILAAFGQPNWLHVSSGDDDTPEVLNTINSWMIIVYSIVGFILLVNLLIAMMAESYSQMEGQSARQVLLNKASLAFELDRAPKVIPPPLNSIVFVLFILYNVIDLLVLAITSEFINEQGPFKPFWRCRNKECKFLNARDVIDEHIKQGWEKDFPCGLCDQLHTMDDIFKSSKRRLRRKARGFSSDENTFCTRLGHGAKEIFVTKIKWKKHSWSCGYCRSRIPANRGADLSRYFNRLRETHNLDPHDVNFIRIMAPQLCPHCYRPRRPRARPTYILENISFLCFVVTVYPLMWCILWPIYVYDAIKNPHSAQKDYKDFRARHNKLYSLRPDAATVRQQMPKSYLHQALISLHHPIWRSLHKHRSTVKGQSLAQSIHSANCRQERVRALNQQEKRSKVTKISHLVMDVVASMSNNRVHWQPTGAELMERMSVISGVDIDSDWYSKHTTRRQANLQKDKLLLMYEAAGGNYKTMTAKSVQKISTLSLKSHENINSVYSMDFDADVAADADADNIALLEGKL